MSALPHASAPREPAIESVAATVDSYPDPPESGGPELSAHEAFNGDSDLPGPSTTYLPPRGPSPPLPNLGQAPDFTSDDEDDEVLTTLPVYMSPVMFPHLDLYQYPLQHRSIAVPSWARNRGKTISARIKEKVGRVEVEIPVDAGTSYWREDRASDLNYVTDVKGVNGDGDDEVVGGYGFGGRGGGNKEKEKEKEKKGKKNKVEKWGDKMRLTSETVPNATGYYSGVIRDGALHLHPISKTMQFRTSLNYLDDADTRHRERVARRSNGGGNDSDDDYTPGGGGGGAKKKAPAASTVPARPMRKLLDEEENDGSGSIKDFRNKMWWLARKEDEDQWVEYNWKTAEDEQVAEALESLVVPEDKRDRLNCKTRPLDFLDRA